MEADYKTLRSVLRWVAVLTVLLVIGYFALVVASTYAALRSSGHSDMSQVMIPAIAALGTLGNTAWSFARPLLQLLLVLLIVDWILKRMGIQFSPGAATTSIGRQFNWDVQAIIAVIVIAAYAVAQLAGLGGEGMKDIALVVVGFYFGTQRRSYEVDPQTGKMRVIEDHTNTLADRNPAITGDKEEVSQKPSTSSDGDSGKEQGGDTAQ